MKPMLFAGFPTFSAMLLLAFFVCLILLCRDVGVDTAFSRPVRGYAAAAILFAAAGGKLLALAVRHLPGASDSHFVFYGGLIGAMLGIRLLARFRGESPVLPEDLLFSYLPLGQAIGRIGCYYSGCCYGRPWDRFPGVLYPVNGEMQRVFPTWFAEAAFCFLLFLLLRYLPFRGFRKKEIYLLGYGLWRFGIEFFRGDAARGLLFGTSVSQIISVLLILTAIFASINRKKTMKEDTTHVGS